MSTDINQNLDIKSDIYKKINLKFISILFKIFKNIKIKINGLDLKIYIIKKNILNYILIFKKNSAFLYTVLIDLIVEDFPNKKNRFLIKYYIRSIYFSNILVITLKTKEYSSVYSLINIYKNSYWLEREVWDLYGIFFLLNIDLRRLLTDYGFKGNPFKKDFPLIGYVEIYFNFFWKNLKFKKITSTQKKNDFYINKRFKNNLKYNINISKD